MIDWGAFWTVVGYVGLVFVVGLAGFTYGFRRVLSRWVEEDRGLNPAEEAAIARAKEMQ